MNCYVCGAELTKSEYCPDCGENVAIYKKAISLSNVYYNDGLEKATVRNLSGAIAALQQSLKLNKNNIDARNLLGLIYFEIGDVVEALSEWVISKNLKTENNQADDYMEELRNNPTHLDMLNQTIKKYNVALRYCNDGSLDVAVIQLKKVLQSNPGFLAAHQLLGLLYLNNGNYAKAEKELTRALRIDNGNTQTRLYLNEAHKMLAPDDDDDRTVTERTGSSDVVEYKSGNDTIIQPIHSMRPRGAVSLISVAIGGVLGLLCAIFLVLPARISAVNDATAQKIASISEEGDRKSSQLQEKDNTISSLNTQIEELQTSIDSYSQTDETVEAMNAMLAAMNVYATDRNNTESLAMYMDKIDMDQVGSTASQEFKDLYAAMIEQVGPTLGSYYYKSGYAAYETQQYETAITDLAKSYKYDNTNAAALYFLGNAYYESGDTDNAKKIYNQVRSEHSDTRYASNADTKIAEINNAEE